MSIVERVFGLSPYVEVVARRIYWSSPWLVRLANKKGGQPADDGVKPGGRTLEQVEEFLQKHGLTRGRLLIVHSSGSVLKRAGYTPVQVIDRLLLWIGPEGTLAMPAFPKYDEEPQGIERMSADVSGLELTYDVRKSIPWTGVLPLKLMQRPGAVRSRHPLNTMAAIGPLARDMMAQNLEGERPLPCGPQSSWKFCADNDALIVALGVDMAHSLTMIHVAEDSHTQAWPVTDWYRDRRFNVVDGGVSTGVVVRERHPRWAAHYAERTLSRDLKRAGLLAACNVDGVSVEVIGARPLLQFLDERKSRAYPYYMIPRGRMRRNEAR